MPDTADYSCEGEEHYDRNRNVTRRSVKYHGNYCEIKKYRDIENIYLLPLNFICSRCPKYLGLLALSSIDFFALVQ